MVDIATLTGACVIALGHVASGLFANDDALADELLAAGRRRLGPRLADAAVGRLPGAAQEPVRRHGEHRRPPGRQRHRGLLPRALRASYKWAHLDIAGTAWRSGKDKGSTARPVPLLTNS